MLHYGYYRKNPDQIYATIQWPFKSVDNCDKESTKLPIITATSDLSVGRFRPKQKDGGGMTFRYETSPNNDKHTLPNNHTVDLNYNNNMDRKSNMKGIAEREKTGVDVEEIIAAGSAHDLREVFKRIYRLSRSDSTADTSQQHAVDRGVRYDNGDVAFSAKMIVNGVENSPRVAQPETIYKEINHGSFDGRGFGDTSVRVADSVDDLLSEIDMKTYENHRFMNGKKHANEKVADKIVTDSNKSEAKLKRKPSINKYWNKFKSWKDKRKKTLITFDEENERSKFMTKRDVNQNEYVDHESGLSRRDCIKHVSNKSGMFSHLKRDHPIRTENLRNHDVQSMMLSQSRADLNHKTNIRDSRESLASGRYWDDKLEAMRRELQSNKKKIDDVIRQLPPNMNVLRDDTFTSEDEERNLSIYPHLYNRQPGGGNTHEHTDIDQKGHVKLIQEKRKVICKRNSRNNDKTRLGSPKIDRLFYTEFKDDDQSDGRPEQKRRIDSLDRCLFPGNANKSDVSNNNGLIEKRREKLGYMDLLPSKNYHYKFSKQFDGIYDYGSSLEQRSAASTPSAVQPRIQPVCYNPSIHVSRNQQHDDYTSNENHTNNANRSISGHVHYISAFNRYEQSSEKRRLCRQNAVSFTSSDIASSTNDHYTFNRTSASFTPCSRIRDQSEPRQERIRRVIHRDTVTFV